MDAIIGTDAWRVASVCGIENVAHPIAVARRLLESNKEVLLVGPGACGRAGGRAPLRRACAWARACSAPAPCRPQAPSSLRSRAASPRCPQSRCSAAASSSGEWAGRARSGVCSLVRHRARSFHALKGDAHFQPKEAFGKVHGMGTVGCVCRDATGAVAVAVSTGGACAGTDAWRCRLPPMRCF